MYTTVYKLYVARLFFMSGLVGKRGVQLRIQTRSHARAFFNSLALQQLFAVFFSLLFLVERKTKYLSCSLYWWLRYGHFDHWGGLLFFSTSKIRNRPNNHAVILLGFLALKPQFHPSLARARVFVAKLNLRIITLWDCTKVRSSLANAIFRCPPVSKC